MSTACKFRVKYQNGKEKIFSHVFYSLGIDMYKTLQKDTTLRLQIIFPIHRQQLIKIKQDNLLKKLKSEWV